MNRDYKIYKSNIKKIVGALCREYRINHLCMTLEEVAYNTYYTKQAVERFEQGLSSSMIILCFYLCKGMPFDDLIRSIKDYI